MKKEAVAVFKLVQIYMSDRKAKVISGHFSVNIGDISGYVVKIYILDKKGLTIYIKINVYAFIR